MGCIQVEKNGEQETHKIAVIDPKKPQELVYNPINSETKFFAVSDFAVNYKITMAVKVYRYTLGAEKASRDFLTVTSFLDSEEKEQIIKRIVPQYLQWQQGSTWKLERAQELDQDQDSYSSLTQTQIETLQKEFITYMLVCDKQKSWKETTKKEIKQRQIEISKQPSHSNKQTFFKNISNSKTLTKTQQDKAFDYIMTAWESVIDSASSPEEYKTILKKVINADMVSFDEITKNEAFIREARDLYTCLAVTELNHLNTEAFSNVFISDVHHYLIDLMLTEFTKEEMETIEPHSLPDSVSQYVPGTLPCSVDKNFQKIYLGLSETDHEKLSLLNEVLQGGINELSIDKLTTLQSLIKEIITKNYSTEGSLEIANDLLAIHLNPEGKASETSSDENHNKMIKNFEITLKAIEVFIQFKEGSKIELSKKNHAEFSHVLAKILNFVPAEEMQEIFSAFKIQIISDVVSDFETLMNFLENLNQEKIDEVVTTFYTSFSSIISTGAEFCDAYEMMPDEIKNKFFNGMKNNLLFLEWENGKIFASALSVLSPEFQSTFFYALEALVPSLTEDLEDFYSIIVAISAANFGTYSDEMPVKIKNAYFDKIKEKLPQLIKEYLGDTEKTQFDKYMLTFRLKLADEQFEIIKDIWKKTIESDNETTNNLSI